MRASTLGCLACNAAVELAPTSEMSKGSTDRYMERVSRAFLHALRNAQTEGRLAGAPVDELAEFLTVTVTGMLVLIRAGSHHDYLGSTARQAIERLHEFAVPSVAP